MARLFVVVLVWYGVCVFLQQTLQFHSTLLWTLKWKSHATRVICCTFETCTYGAGSAVHCKFQFNCRIKKSKRLTNLSNVSIFSKMIIGGYGRLQHYLSLKKIQHHLGHKNPQIICIIFSFVQSKWSIRIFPDPASFSHIFEWCTTSRELFAVTISN